MKTVFEDKAQIRKQGASFYVLLPETFHKFIGIDREVNEVVGDFKIAMEQTKYGNCLSVWNVEQQKRQQREMKKEEKKE